MNPQPGERGHEHRWHKVPLMWFVVGLPAVVVVAGFVTLFLAIRARDVVVRDDFRSEGLAIYPDPARDAAAAALRARATLLFDDGAGRLRVKLALRGGDTPGSLVVILSHATRAELDRMITVQGNGGEYAGGMQPLPPGHWYVEITPPDRAWRLKGDFTGDAKPITLQAAGVS